MASEIPVFTVLHPVIHQPYPAFDQVRSRADSPAGRVLDTAASLARWRLRLSDQIDTLRLERGARPWPVAFQRDPGDLAPTLQPVDVLRALLVEEIDALADIVPSPNGLLSESAAHWKNAAASSPDGDTPALDFAWARRWALADLRHGHPTVDVPYLIASMGHAALSLLVPLSKLVDEDLASEREVVRRCVENARRATGDRVFEPLLPAYLDRHGGIAAMDRALDEHHGVLIVGNEETGRTALLEAWLRRLATSSKPGSMANARIWQNPFDEPWLEDVLQFEEVIAGQATVLGLTPKGRRVFYDSREEDPLQPDETTPNRLWGYEPEYPEGSLETALVARCAEWASEPWKQVYMAIVVTPEERERLVARVPLIAQFPAIEVPPYDTLDHLPIWLCHAMDRPELGLEQALAVMSELRPADIQRMKPWDVEHVLGSGLAQRLWDPSRLAALEPTAWLQRAVWRIEQGRDPWQREMLGAKGRFVARFIGEDDRFAATHRLQVLLREGNGENGPLPVFEPDEDVGRGTVPPSIQPRAQTRVPPLAQDLPLDLYFVYRSHSEGSLGKRVRRVHGSSVLEWFQMAWHEAGQADDLDAWVNETFGGPVPGMASLFQDVGDEGLDAPETWEELHELLQDHLYVSGGSDSIRQSAHVLRVRTNEDDVDVAYYLFDSAYAKAHPDRCAFLLQEQWPLPEDSTDAPFEPENRPTPLLPAGHGPGATYVCLLTSYHNGSLMDLRPRVFPGVRLPELCEHLRSVVPLAEQKRDEGRFSWFETWPLEMRLLRAMVSDACDIGAALDQCNRYPLIHVATNVQHTRLGIGPHAEAREAFVEAASDARKVRRNVERTKFAIGEHIAQMSLWTNDTFGYQQWFIFDDQWAAAHCDLASSLLRYASDWDPLI
jgi:hypothetical protein